jgi:hypothetical protein|tara:strand:- start:412 stop:1005 length:594 start_codon:yes stop_codon:yes gene_type:complete
MTKKIVITGHTHGVGKTIYDMFCDQSCHEIVGMSRSNGYDIEKDFDKIVAESEGAELFINNAYRDGQQLKLLHALKDKVESIVVMGSVSRFYPEIIPTDYVHDKQELAEACRMLSMNPDSIPILHLDLSFIEGTVANNSDDFTSDFNITQQEIVETIVFWCQHPNIRQVEFNWKLTPHVLSELNRVNPNLDPTRITI